MPFIVKEIRRSRSHVSSAKPTARREYMAWNQDSSGNRLSATGNEIETAIDLVAPAAINGLVIESVSIDPLEEDERVWNAVYNYATTEGSETPETLAEEISFDLGSQTINVTQSFLTVNKYAKSGQIAPDFKGGIGWDGEQFTGIDRMFEVFSFSITKYVAAATVENSQYIRNLRDAAFHVNNAAFRGFSANEVLFAGAAGSKRSVSDYAVTFRFMASKNAAGLIVGDITGITKAAWDYLWVLYEEVEDTAADFTTQRPKAAYVERLYTAVNFPTLLGVTA